MQLRDWIKATSWAAAGAVLALGNPADAAPGQAEIAPKTVRDDVYPKAAVTFPRGIVGRPDVEYANLTGFRPLLLDLYLHDARARPLPLVIWIHGGGWNRGDSRTSGTYANWPAVLADLAARGFVVASVNYRLSGEAKFPAQIQDVKAAIRFLRAHAAEYGVDPARVYLWGGSAGGHLAALAATSCGAAAFAPEASTGRLSSSEAKTAVPPNGSDCVQAAAAWFGIFDFAIPGSVNFESLIGCSPDACAKAHEAAGPVAYVDASDPPMLLIHGTADTTASPRQSEVMAARLRKAGVPVETLFIPDVDHGWIGANPAVTRNASLLALQRTFDFFEAQAAKVP
jgi:acetyl esterase/lipase